MKNRKHQVVADANCHDFHYTHTEIEKMKLAVEKKAQTKDVVIDEDFYKKNYRYREAVDQNKEGFNYSSEELDLLRSLLSHDYKYHMRWINAPTHVFHVSQKTATDVDLLHKRYRLIYKNCSDEEFEEKLSQGIKSDGNEDNFKYHHY